MSDTERQADVTPAMLAAGEEAFRDALADDCPQILYTDAVVTAIYRAMRAAAGQRGAPR